MAMSALLPDPMVPVLFHVTKVKRELSDTVTLELVPDGKHEPFAFLPGQFNMLYRFGVGEVPISISGDPNDPDTLVHTVRAVGTVSNALCTLKTGDKVGLRGPFGSAWPIYEAEGHDVVIVAGGIGLAPVRPVIYHILNNRAKYGEVVVLYGARTPDDMLYCEELAKWRARFDLSVDATVDHATSTWRGKVGVVPQLIEYAKFDPHETIALVCGPEVMMKFSAQALEVRGVTRDRIYLSMERNMKCAIGFCGHCQYGGSFVCKDGPVFPFDAISNIFAIRGI